MIGILLGPVEEVDLNSLTTVQRCGGGVSPPKERHRRARLANLPVARRRRSLAPTCMQPVLG